MTKRTPQGPPAAMLEDETPRVVSVVTIDGHDESALLALAAGLAGSLDAPLAAAILSGAHERGVGVASVDRAHLAAGPSSPVAGGRVVVGGSTLFAQLGISIDDLRDWPERMRQQGQQVVFVAVDGRTAGFLGVAVPACEGAPRRKESHMSMRESRTQPTEPAVITRGGTVDFPEAQAPESFDLGDGDRFDLRIAPVSKSIGGQAVRMLAYNGSIPGPTLRVRQGSELVVQVANEGDLEATVHWHGLRLDNRFDGTTSTQSPIPVGASFTYRLAFPDPGVYWYHPHIREDYGQEMGLYGNIVVVPAEPGYWPAVHRELTLTLDDLLVEDGQVAAFDPAQPTFSAMGRFGNVLLVNGEPALALRARRGEVVRLYLTNTANTRVFNVGLPGARMKLVGGDSGRYEREAFVEAIVIAPSERAVVDVLFEKADVLTLEHRTPDRTYSLATVAVEDEPAQPSLAPSFERLRTAPELAAERADLARHVEARPDKTLAFVAEMDLGTAHHSKGGEIVHVCPMHPDVVSAEPGRCPKCGMKLLATEVAEALYVCPMHPKVTAAKADRCPRCGMKLVPASLLTQPALAAGHGHPDHGGSSSEQARGEFHAPAGIEWEDDMFEVNRRTNPANTRWKLIDRETGAEGTAIDWRFRVGQRVKIRLVNEIDSDHPMHHPFHLHGAGRFLILSRDGVVEPNLVWKDTVLVPTGQTVDILFDVTQPGVWMAHCHIAEHHESGMMLGFQVDR